MAFVAPRDRVLERSTSNSQTVFAVTGASDASYNAFSASMGVGDTTIGGVVEPGVAFKSGILTYSATNQVTVTTVKESNGTFSASGIKQVFMGMPASVALMVDGAQALTTAQQAQARSNIGANPTIPPGGRITLASGVAVMASSQAAQTRVYWTPYGGDTIPIYDGASMSPTQFPEVWQDTTDTTKSPAAVAASKIYDLFAWNDGGTKRVTRGPAWTNSTTRGYTLTVVNGIPLNTSAITNGPAALRGTWVGTIASNAGSTIDFIFGGSASGGLAGVFNVWNAYNRVDVGCKVINTAAAYTYTSNTIRQAGGSAGNQVSFVVGATDDAVFVSDSQIVQLVGAANAFVAYGIGLDVSNAYSEKVFFQNASSGTWASGGSVAAIWNPGIGTHTVYAIENSDGFNANTFNAPGAGSYSGLSFRLRM